jgi:hypothetical protein
VIPGRSRAGIVLVQVTDGWNGIREFEDTLFGVVVRSVIDNYDFEITCRKILGCECIETHSQNVGVIEGGNHDRYKKSGTISASRTGQWYPAVRSGGSTAMLFKNFHLTPIAHKRSCDAHHACNLTDSYDNTEFDPAVSSFEIFEISPHHGRKPAGAENSFCLP